MNYVNNTILGGSAILAASISSAFAGSVVSPVIKTPATPASDWQLIATIYGLLPGLDGDVGVDGFNVGVDESFIDYDQDPILYDVAEAGIHTSSNYNFQWSRPT